MNELPPYDYTPAPERDYSFPDEYSVAVWVIINVEHFRVDEAYREGDYVPNSKDQGRRDYGTKAGYWRLLDILDEYDIPTTLALNGEACEHQPKTLEAAVDRDWAVMGHGLTNSHRLVDMDHETQRKTIEETRDRIEEFTGDSPTGWLSPGVLGDFDTLELLQQAGFEYLCDWCADDQPFEFDNGLVSVPYSLDLNDKGLFGRQGLTGAQYRDSILDAFETLRSEGQQPNSGRVLPIPIHPHITGQPFRAPYLGEVLSKISTYDDVWLTTGDAIADHFINNRSCVGDC